MTKCHFNIFQINNNKEVGETQKRRREREKTNDECNDRLSERKKQNRDSHKCDFSDQFNHNLCNSDFCIVCVCMHM